ncbi:MAG: hypothetical protein AAFV29_10335 [Myxococcota bacterium]
MSESVTDRLADLLTKLNGIDFRAYESMSTARLLTDLVPMVNEIEKSLVKLLLRKDRPNPETPFGRTVDRTVRSMAAARKRVRALTPTVPQWVALLAISDVIGRLTKLAQMWADELVEEPDPNVYESDVERGIQLRKLYCKIFRFVLDNADPKPGEVPQRLRKVGNLLAVTMGHADFSDARPRDRLAMLAFQARLIAWLRDPDPTDGLRLWGDLIDFAELLSHISRRRELIAHDKECVERLLATIANGEERSAIYEMALALQGLSTNLDDVLDCGLDMNMPDLQLILVSVRHDFSLLDLPRRDP